MSTPLLPLKDLADRHIGLTFELAASYLQAAQVCLDLHHSPPVEFILQDEQREMVVTVVWEPPDERMRNAWAYQTTAIEDGAYACALAAAELMFGLVAVKRAETLTGADFYVVPIGKPINNLKEWIRLEISGTQSDEVEVKTRLRQKVKQAAAGRSNLPAVAIVVGFKVRLIKAQTVGGAL